MSVHAFIGIAIVSIYILDIIADKNSKPPDKNREKLKMTWDDKQNIYFYKLEKEKMENEVQN